MLICTSTDYDAWREEDPVTLQEVLQTLAANADASNLIARDVLGHLHDVVKDGRALTQAKGAMQYSIITKRELWPEEEKKRLAFLLPYFKD